MDRRATSFRRIGFQRISVLALGHADCLASRWLADGHREGAEWVARNPTRADHKTGSFKVNLITGCWSDFATGDKGGDLISLAAYLFSLSQKDAALKLAEMLGIDPYDR